MSKRPNSADFELRRCPEQYEPFQDHSHSLIYDSDDGDVVVASIALEPLELELLLLVHNFHASNSVL